MKRYDRNGVIPVVAQDGVSPTFINAIETGLGLLPVYAQSLLRGREFTAIAGKTLCSLRKGTFFDDTSSGCILYEEREIIFGERYFSRYRHVWNNSDAIGIAFHETGHGLDFFTYGGDGCYGSRGPEFIAAYNRDKQDLVNSGFSLFRAIHADFTRGNGQRDVEGLLYHFRRIFLNGDSGPAETYAELWAHVNGFASSMPRCGSLAAFMPRCAEIVRDHHLRVYPAFSQQALPPLNTCNRVPRLVI